MSALGPHFILAIVAALLLLTTAIAQTDPAGLAVDGVAPSNFRGKRCFSLIDGCDTCSRYMFPRDPSKTYGEGAKLANFNGGKYWKINVCQICKIGWSLFGDGDFYNFKKFPKYCIPPQECQGEPDSSGTINSNGFDGKCYDKKIGASCTADCYPGYTGGYTAVCTETTGAPVWNITGQCKKVPVGNCPPTPKPNPRLNGKPFVCTNTSIGAVCTADCEPQATGGYKATCYAPLKGKPRWLVKGQCKVVPSTCPATIPTPNNSYPFPNTCNDQLTSFTNLPCFAKCLPNYVGGHVAVCVPQENGKVDRLVLGGCVPDTGPLKCPPISSPTHAGLGFYTCYTGDDTASSSQPNSEGTTAPLGMSCAALCDTGFIGGGMFAACTLVDKGTELGADWLKYGSCT